MSPGCVDETMQFKNLFDDDRAVSPVIGVILMVAITVILAAVIGTFVLGLGDQVQQTTPQASFGFDTSNEKKNVTVTHESGDGIENTNLNISSTQDFHQAGTSEAAAGSYTWSALGASADVTAGTSVEINAGTEADTAADFSGATIRVVYNNPDADSSATLGKFEVPN